MRRIFAAIIIVAFAFMIFLLVYTPAQDFLRRILGPTVTGMFSGIASSIVTSPVWQNIITVWPYSFAIGCTITFFITAIAAYYWHTGWNWLRRNMVKSAISESGMGYRETKGGPVSTTVPASPNPVELNEEVPAKKDEEA